MHFYTFAFFILFANQVMASFTPDIGARSSVVGAQQLLVSPPIPNLEGGKTTYTPQVGFMTATVDGSEIQSSTTMSYSGEVKGASGGIGISSPSSGRLSWFGIFGGDSLTGEIAILVNGSAFGSVKNIQSQSVAFAAGPSYRFTGEANSDFSAGVFLGPALIKVNSQFDLSTSNATYTLDDVIYGAYGGLQVKLRIDSLVINPYVLYMYDLSPQCKKMTISDSQFNFTGLCPSDMTTPNMVEMKNSFGGAGLFLGWKKLRFNIYSKASPDSAFNDVKITNYSIYYTFGD